MFNIFFNLETNRVDLTTKFSHRSFSNTDTGRKQLFEVLIAAAQYEVRLGATPSGRDVTDAVLAYDLKEIERMLVKYDEKGKVQLSMEDLEIEI